MFVTGLTLGLGAAAPIGPVNIEIARRTLRGGFAAGFALGCGAVTVDVTYAMLSSLSLARLVAHSRWQTPIAVVGFLFLAYLGVQALRAVPGHLKADPLANARPVGSAKGAYGTGVLMTLLNPMTLMFWFVELPAQGALTQDSRLELPMICAGVFIGTLGWVIAFCSFLGALGRQRRNWQLALADGAGGVMLLGLAMVGLWRLARIV